jgi:hypothetical protein
VSSPGSRAARSAIALAAACAGLALASGAGAGLSVGVNDDAPKMPELSSWFYSTMQTEGLRINALTVLWDENAPTDIPAAPSIDGAVESAAANGVAIELDLYPAHSMAFTGGKKCAPSPDPESCGNTSRIQQFAAWTAQVAQRFPSVTQFVVMNECNQPRFVNPQWDSAGGNQSAEVCGRALAAAYDAIKTVNAQAVVWGIGLSPRGNDSPGAVSNSSTKPVTFIGALGTWFRAFALKTHRTTGIMDGFDFHPYPVPQSQPFKQGYADVREASVTNLPRIYQAFFDAFGGTPQRTIGQQAGGGLPVSLNETGVQTQALKPGYQGTEVSANSAGGVVGSFASQDFQAAWYRQMLDTLACDPNVRVVNIFHLIDEADLAGWQSGLYFVDQTPKKSAQAVQDWLAQTGGACQGRVVPWTPTSDSAASASSRSAVKTPAACKVSKARCTAYIAATAAKLKKLEARARGAKGQARSVLVKQAASTRATLAAARTAWKGLVR